MGYSNEPEIKHKFFWGSLGTFFIVLIFVGLFLGFTFGIQSCSRYQARQNAINQIYLNEKAIAQTQQLVEVEKQKAQIRIAEANGIAEAQRIINVTLTDRYLQHEAIKAQERMANSPNHTQIYIPVGTNGIPLVMTANPTDPATGNTK